MLISVKMEPFANWIHSQDIQHVFARVNGQEQNVTRHQIVKRTAVIAFTVVR